MPSSHPHVLYSPRYPPDTSLSLFLFLFLLSLSLSLSLCSRKSAVSSADSPEVGLKWGHFNHRQFCSLPLITLMGVCSSTNGVLFFPLSFFLPYVTPHPHPYPHPPSPSPSSVPLPLLSLFSFVSTHTHLPDYRPGIN